MVNIPYSIPGYSFSYKISTVGTVGQLEYSMAHSSDTYSIGRIGAEIAYTIATEKFGLNDVEINEVSQGGVDLITADGSAVIQARLLMRNRSGEFCGRERGYQSATHRHGRYNQSGFQGTIQAPLSDMSSSRMPTIMEA